MTSEGSRSIKHHHSVDRDAKRRACDVCKLRKVRCSGDNPCSNCVRTGAMCERTLSHGRLAQAERRVSHLKDRLRMFENAWKVFVPNIDLTVAVHAIENDDLSSFQPFTRETSNDFEHVDVTSPQGVMSAGEIDDILDDQIVEPATLPEVEHEDADTLTWDESIEIATVSDGIGSLSIDSKGVGYMGPQSGNALLRSIQAISSTYFSSTSILNLPPISTPELTEDTLKSWSFANQCVDCYFRFYHCAYPILHEGYFRAQLLGALPKPKDGSWPILLNTVLAIGARSGNTYDKNADMYFYREASRHMSWDILQRGTLSLVQALALLANYLQKRDRPNSGFNLLGVAMNMAQGIGLHRELSGPTISAFTMEVRRRVWWTLFIFDSGARLTFGRPTLSLGGMNTLLPRNLDDKDLAVDLDELPASRETPTVVSSLIAQVKLAEIGNRANETILEARLPTWLTMKSIGDQVRTWCELLPAYLQEGYSNPEFLMFDAPRMILLWRSMHLRIVIYRPFVLDDIRKRKRLDFSSPETPASLCLYAADECITSISRFWNQTTSHHGSLVWYVCYWLVTAVFVHVTCILYEPQSVSASQWRQHIDSAREVLEEIGPRENTALRAAQIIEKIMGLVPSSPDSTFFAMNEPIRMEVAELWNQSWADMVVPQELSPPDFTG